MRSKHLLVKNIIRTPQNITRLLTGKKKIITFSFFIIIFSMATLNVYTPSSHYVSALSYQSRVNTGFTFNPTISITFSGSDLTILNLIPGTYSDSNIITVGISTNTSYGHKLLATAGTSTTDTNLTHTTDDSYNFTSLATTPGAAPTLSDITSNYWGYSYCPNTTSVCNDVSNWISGSVNNTASGYAGLPLDNDDNGETGIVLIDENSINDQIQFKIGAKASNSQPAGVYTNVINFYAVANPSPDETGNTDP